MAGVLQKNALTITANVEQIAEVNRLLAGIANGADDAIRRAINRTVDQGRTRIVRGVAEEVPLKQKDIRDSVFAKRATKKNLIGKIVISKRPVPLIDYGARPTDWRAYLPRKGKRRKSGKSGKATRRVKGVSVKALKKKPRQILPGTFVAIMKSGHKGVFERVNLPGRKRRKKGGWQQTRRVWKEKFFSDNSSKGRYKTELKIVERFGPSVMGVFTDLPGFAADVIADVATNFAKNLNDQVKVILQGLDKKRTPATA